MIMLGSFCYEFSIQSTPVFDFENATGTDVLLPLDRKFLGGFGIHVQVGEGLNGVAHTFSPTAELNQIARVYAANQAGMNFEWAGRKNFQASKNARCGAGFHL
jgi:hypothetical protein